MRVLRRFMPRTAGAVSLAYLLVYVMLPKHFSYYNPFLEHHRIFRHGYQTGLFLPAAYAECLLLRVFPRLYGSEGGAQFVALDWQYPAFRVQATPYASRDAVLPDDQDIVEHVAGIGFPAAGSRQLPDGSTVACKYIDCDLDRAEEFLGESYSRPWTVSETLRRFRSATDDETRV